MILTSGTGYIAALCQCCSSVAGRPPTLATYRWTGPNGVVTPLCVSCCAHWRLNAKDDPSLAPQRIETIPLIPVTDVRWEFR